jgi:hypothetical protein
VKIYRVYITADGLMSQLEENQEEIRPHMHRVVKTSSLASIVSEGELVAQPSTINARCYDMEPAHLCIYRERTE